jgi:calcium-dependent protein kinase
MQKTVYNEYKVLKNLDHPNIVDVYEIFDELRFVSIITELCTGGDVQNDVIEKGRL